MSHTRLVVGVQLADRLRPKLGATTVVAVGFLVLAAGCLLGTFTRPDDGFGFAVIWIGIVGTGMGLTLQPTMDIAMGSLPTGASGVGSGVLQAFRQAGSTFGVAICGTMLNAVYRAHLETGALPGGLAHTARSSAAAGIAVAHATASAGLWESVRESFVAGMSGVLWLSVAAAVIGAVITVRYLPRRAEDVDAAYSSGEHAGV